MASPGTLLRQALIVVGPPAVAIAFAALAPRPARQVARLGDRVLWRAGRSRWSIPLFAALVSMLLSVGTVLVSRHVPQPNVHDEFSYVLASDTFSHGRLTNPPHPMWEHFETFHVIQHPTYMSKYMPGQGLALAIGQVLTHHAIVGVWISLAFACGATAWMLMGWVPRRWALVGGILAAMLPSVMAWGQTYWGGAVAMAGGALALGAFRRIVSRPSARMAAVLGLGIAMMAVSRPYEGVLLALACGVGLLVWAIRLPDQRVRIRSAAAVFVPLAACAMALAAFIGYYNFRVTGNPLRMPYAVHEDEYGATPLFLFQPPKPVPQYRHKELREFQETVLAGYYKERQHYWPEAKRRVMALLTSYVQPRSAIFALLLAPLALRRDRWMWVAIASALLVTAATFFSTWLFMHYLAPVICVVALVIVQGMRQLRQVRFGGIAFGRLAVLAIFVAMLWPTGRAFAKAARRNDRGLPERRAELLNYLARQPGRHLVIVHYDYTGGFEWVYNDADIDGAKVVFAREMSPEKNAELIAYFKDREAWVINGNVAHPKLMPYGANALDAVRARN